MPGPRPRRAGLPVEGGNAERRRRAAHLPLVGLTLFLAACAPVTREAGPPVTSPTVRSDSLTMADGAVLPLRTWLPSGGNPRAVVVAVHGFNDYSNAFEGAGPSWADRGIATYAYDQRGFGATENRGLWPGAETLAQDLRTVCRLVAARHPETPLYVLGESMGAAVALLAVAGEAHPRLEGLVLVAPAVRPWQAINPVGRAFLWLVAHTVPWWSVSGRGLDIVPSDNVEMLRALAEDPLVIHATRMDALYGLAKLMDAAFAATSALRSPSLLLYGTEDELVPKDVVRTLIRRLAAPLRVAIYPGGYHMLLRDLEAEIAIADVAAWIADREAPLPSRAPATIGESAGAAAKGGLDERPR